MIDDDFLNLVLGNDPNGPSVTQIANGGASGGAPPANSGDNNSPDMISSLLDCGVSPSVIASMMPQLQGTDAASPSPSAPAPTMDQIAMMYGMNPQQIADIGNQAKIDAMAQVGLKNLAGPAVESVFPEVGGVIDIMNHISEPFDEQYIQDAPDKAVYQHLNDSLAQPFGSPSFPGLRSRFPFP